MFFLVGDNLGHTQGSRLFRRQRSPALKHHEWVWKWDSLLSSVYRAEWLSSNPMWLSKTKYKNYIISQNNREIVLTLFIASYTRTGDTLLHVSLLSCYCGNAEFVSGDICGWLSSCVTNLQIVTGSKCCIAVYHAKRKLPSLAAFLFLVPLSKLCWWLAYPKNSRKKYW